MDPIDMLILSPRIYYRAQDSFVFYSPSNASLFYWETQ